MLSFSEDNVYCALQCALCRSLCDGYIDHPNTIFLFVNPIQYIKIIISRQIKQGVIISYYIKTLFYYISYYNSITVMIKQIRTIA